MGWRGNELEPVQEAFIQADAFQCGGRTAEQVMSVHPLLDADPDSSDE